MIEQYEPERTWETEPVEVELIVVGGYSRQRRLFTPWPAHDAAAFLRKLTRGRAPCTVPLDPPLAGWWQPTGIGLEAA